MTFTEEAFWYARADEVSNPSYMTVFQRVNEKEMRFNEIVLYKDEVSDGHIKACYSMLFDLISKRQNES
ncbi:MAG: hypothetical protein JEZ08_04105 [Clostridiales bacterium]|nr:hypothetical protein [Clostridiales bacterium]